MAVERVSAHGNETRNRCAAGNMQIPRFRAFRHTAQRVTPPSIFPSQIRGGEGIRTPGNLRYGGFQSCAQRGHVRHREPTRGNERGVPRPHVRQHEAAIENCVPT